MSEQAPRKSRFSLRTRKDKFKLSQESAEEQLITLLEYYDIDVDTMPGEKEDIDEDTGMTPRQAFERTLDNLTPLIRSGRLEVKTNEKGRLTVVHTLNSGQTVVYGELSAAAKVAMDCGKKTGNYKRIYSFMGALASLPVEEVMKFHFSDLHAVELLGAVFTNA